MQYIHWICHRNLSRVSVVKKTKWLLTQCLYCSWPYQSCGWRFKSFGMWYCVFGEVLGILKDHSASMFRVKHSKNKSDCLTMKMKVVWSFKNVGNYWPNKMVSHPRRFESSTTLLWEPHILHPCRSVLKPYINMILTLYLTAKLQILSMWLQTGPVQLWSILVPTRGESRHGHIFW